MKTLLFALLVGATGDAQYVKQTDPIVLNAGQITSVASFVTSIAPGVVITDVTAIHCVKQPTGVVCVVQSNATATATAYLADVAAGRAAGFVGIAP